MASFKARAYAQESQNVIAVDTNLLVYAHRGEMTQHRVASQAMRSLIEGARSWAVPWPCVHEFFATVTASKFRPASSPDAAWEMIQSIVATPSVRLIGEGTQHLRLLANFVARGNVRGGMIHDARIAAICLAHGVDVLWTCDRDFSRFPELKTHNPLK